MELVIGAVVVVGLLAWAVSIYNRLVTLRNRYKNGFAQIDVQLKRRYDLIPNLVETARAYMAHERETLEALVVARNTALTAAAKAAQAPGEAAAMQGLTSAEAGLSGALSKLFALSEAHPDLKANQTMMQLSEELGSTENKVAFARQAFNDSVMEFNTCVESFPDLVFAGAFGFPRAELLVLENPAEERQAPKVSFR
ncbi:MAG: LemA family protein [Rhodospirillales bacterium]|nr:MAG: LemA family protein [Rhodospirillales bacterium]